MSNNLRNLKRRDFIKTTSAAAGTLAMGTYLPRAWAAEPMRVSAYGGYFEDSLAEFVYPEFTKATGIEIESVSQTGSDSWFVSIDTAVKAGGRPPTDVTMGGGSAPRRFGQLYQHLTRAKFPAPLIFRTICCTARKTGFWTAWQCSPGIRSLSPTPRSIQRRPNPGVTCGCPSMKIH